MAKVVITGIAGFIGSALARALVQEGADVYGVDDFSTGKLSNLEPIRARIHLTETSIEDADALRFAFRGADYVFHEAALPSVTISVQDPVGTHGPNLTGTLCVLEEARAAGVRRVMYAASSAAYGDAPELPKREDMVPAPISPYAVQKLAGEHYLAAFSRVYGLETVALRYFNIFGPRQDASSPYSGVLALFINQMSAGITPTIFGTGDTSRDFTFIEDVVQANLLAAKAPSSASGKVFNVATGRAITLLEAYETIKQLTGYSGSIHFKPERTGDIRHSVADISAAREMLGYQPGTSFHDGLQQTIAWYQESRAAQPEMAAIA